MTITALYRSDIMSILMSLQSQLKMNVISPLSKIFLLAKNQFVAVYQLKSAELAAGAVCSDADCTGHRVIWLIVGSLDTSFVLY